MNINKALLVLVAAAILVPTDLFAEGNAAVLNKYLGEARESGILQEATLICAGNAADYGTVPLPVMPAALPGPSAVGYADDAVDVSVSKQALDIVRGEFGLSKISVKISAKNAAFQSNTLKNGVKFDQALREAMKSFMEDPASPESPLALMLDAAYEEMLPGTQYPDPVPPQVMKRAREMLLTWLDRPTTVISLLGTHQVPDGKESVRENWIFSLWMPDYSDHAHWAVIDRTGAGQPVYNYGFN